MADGDQAVPPPAQVVELPSSIGETLTASGGPRPLNDGEGHVFAVPPKD